MHQVMTLPSGQTHTVLVQFSRHQQLTKKESKPSSSNAGPGLPNRILRCCMRNPSNRYHGVTIEYLKRM
eukprot:SAG25_NODE_3769_length_975_cov_1.932648_1_plen_68_part_01